MKNLILLLIFFLPGMGFLEAQHLEMTSNFTVEPLLYDPSAAGAKGYLAATAGRRIQWLGFDGAPRTNYLVFHTPLVNKRLNLGLVIIQDEIGIFRKNKFNAVYAYRISMGKNKLSFGINGGLVTGKSSWINIQTTQGPDQVFPAADEKFVYPEAGAGIRFQTPRFHIALASQNLLPQKYISTITNPSTVFTSEYKLEQKSITWTPALLLRYVHRSPLQAELQLAATFNKQFTLSAGYRLDDAILLQAGFRLNEQLRFYYSYDIGISVLQNNHTGSHELILRYEFGYPVKSENPRSQK